MASAPSDIAALRRFVFERVLSHDPATQTIALLGSFPSSDDETTRNTAIVRIERAALPVDQPAAFLHDSGVADVRLIGSNDIYTWLLGWLTPSPSRPDVKLNIICPATEVHIRKYSAQNYTMVRETPALYARIVKPYIAAFPASRTQWVQDILAGRSEADKVLHRAADGEHGYVLLPDMKWDERTLPALYLVALASAPALRSLRDLTRAHLALLRGIRRAAHRVAAERWGLARGALRLFVHYPPSYYRFHVHIVHVEYYQGLLGMTVGQAHLLDDIISLLELNPDDEGPSVFERMTLTYGLGDQHGLYEAMRGAQVEVDD
ncbi:scavenger mRNA decapping enzyme [Daedalea quercina L-15889]|uniref:Scavenger mRNA decapping enzyme n=1 Tax=Daedalea quercina L-15889 TaxID=1314783 RepID=A0A165Q127_9APHY|nr:scavenger mRNA decapping enzyme [Daedalea quercina L-15889]